ncbi:MAG TPA: methyltransferase domain-containing protein [Anaerolineales bacterium]|nr:methyltransferase domain-containing protein [Anaerolineales bacterium]
MEKNNTAEEQVDEDEILKHQMEQAVPSYDAYMKKMTFGREHVLRQVTVELAQVKPGDSVLEVGCGTGTLTLAAKRQAGPSGKVTGIDVIPEMVEISQRKAAEAREDIAFQVGSIDNIPFPDSHFDVVLCSFMIFHMSENTRRKGIAEIYRVLKPQGRWLILDLALPDAPVQRAIAKRILGGGVQHDLRGLFPLMDASGFANLESGMAKFRIFGISVFGFVRGIKPRMR